MLRRVVSSESVLSVGYNDATEELEIEFWQGETYRYSAVPRSVYEDLMRSPSKGEFFNASIRDVFASRRVN